jgi:5-methylcytosine-specific restriction endonuclease McrA
MTNPLYRTAAWREASKRCLLRDGFRCCIGLPGCMLIATTADHVVELHEGGAAFDPNNLQAACRRCNSAKSNTRRAERRHREQEMRPW